MLARSTEKTIHFRANAYLVECFGPQIQPLIEVLQFDSADALMNGRRISRVESGSKSHRAPKDLHPLKVRLPTITDCIGKNWTEFQVLLNPRVERINQRGDQLLVDS